MGCYVAVAIAREREFRSQFWSRLPVVVVVHGRVVPYESSHVGRAGTRTNRAVQTSKACEADVIGMSELLRLAPDFGN